MKNFKKILFAILLVGTTKVCYSQALDTTVDSTRYATIYIYRPFTFSSVLLGFGIREGERKLFKLWNGAAHEVKIYKSGPLLLSAKSIERKFKLPIDIELGKSYYVKCKPGISYISANPKLLLVDAEAGKQEYQAIVDEE